MRISSAVHLSLVLSVAISLGYTNGFNIGALMEKGIQLTGCGQAPVQKYWEEILNDYIIPGKFDPTL